MAHCHFGLGRLYKGIYKDEQAQEHLTTEMDMSFWLKQVKTELEGLC